MKLERSTTSFCNVCYKEIPAMVTVRSGSVMLDKRCVAHGPQVGEVERDPVFYAYIQGLKSPSIYDGVFIDVTERCNLRCEYCYYDLQKLDPEGKYSLDAVTSECLALRRYAPFIITGGEPTTREDLPELLAAIKQIGPVELITNGVNLADAQYFERVAGPLLEGKHLHVNLSIHRAETGQWRKVLSLARARNCRLNSAIIVVDAKEGFIEALRLAHDFKEDVVCWRIKAASNIWHEQKAAAGSGKIFVSTLLQWLEEAGHTYRIETRLHNKSTFINVVTDTGLWLMLVSWYDVTNVDLQDIECPPYYRAQNGELCNFVTHGLINEGVAKGWLKGRRIAGIQFAKADLKAPT